MADQEQTDDAPNTAPPVASSTAISNIDQDKMWAMIGYSSAIFGIPLFIVPLAMNDTLPLATYHARQAAAIYVGFLVSIVGFSVLTMVTCGFGALLFPAVFLVWVPSIHGLMLAAQGVREEPLGVFGLGDRMFGQIGKDR